MAREECLGPKGGERRVEADGERGGAASRWRKSKGSTSKERATSWWVGGRILHPVRLTLYSAVKLGEISKILRKRPLGLLHN